MRKAWFFTAVVFGASLTSVCLGYSGGDGSSENPYQIASKADLLVLAVDIDDYDKCFILTADIDMGDQSFTRAIIVPDTDNAASGFQGTTFTGVFNGNDYSIINLKISGTHHLGLFGIIGTNGFIQNLKINNIEINGTEYIGGIAGRNYGSICNCSTSGNITASGAYIGGIAGINGEDSNIYNNSYGFIFESFSSVSISGEWFVGGLVGQNQYGQISSCYATGNITATGYYVWAKAGGLVGENGYSNGGGYGLISLCYSMGNVTGHSHVGGLVGYNEDGIIKNCYTTSRVTADTYSGGLTGWNDGIIENCFWDTDSTNQTVMCGTESVSGTGCDCDCGKTTEEMMDPNTFLSAGWDFTWENVNGPSDDWTVPAEDGYMILAWQSKDSLPPLPSFSGGTGEPNTPFIISTPEELNQIGHNFRLMDCYFILENDINLDDMPFFIIGKEIPFYGHFDGKGHSIHNLAFSSSTKNNVGLLGALCGRGIVRDLSLENISINTEVNDSNKFVGGLLGFNKSGTISNCSSNGIVTGGRYAGGLIGCNTGRIKGSSSECNVTGYRYAGGLTGGNRGQILNCTSMGIHNGSIRVGGLVGLNCGNIFACFTDGSVNSNNMFAGGLVGDNSGIIQSSYSRTNVYGYRYVGGFVGGLSNGETENCYSCGQASGNFTVGAFVGIVEQGIDNYCYFLDTVGLDNGYGIPLDDQNMKIQSNFLGWDFTNETINGTNDYWRMCADGVDYPRLNWESIDGDFTCPDGVSVEDLDYFAERWLMNNCTSSNNYCGGADMDASDSVQMTDYSIFAQHWLE